MKRRSLPYRHAKRAELRWYQRTGVVLALLVLFFPVGLLLMWVAAPWRRFVKWACTLAPGLLVIAAAAGSEPQPAATNANAEAASTGATAIVSPPADTATAGLSPRQTQAAHRLVPALREPNPRLHSSVRWERCLRTWQVRLRPAVAKQRVLRM